MRKVPKYDLRIGKPDYRAPKMRTPDLSVPRLESEEEQTNREYQEWQALHGNGTKPEFLVWKYLVNQKHLREGVDFIFQSSKFGGRRVFGGVVIDFYIPARNMVWRVQGERFHMLMTADRTDDAIEKFQLEGYGYVVIDLWVNDLLSRPRYVLDLAWSGQEVQSIGAR